VKTDARRQAIVAAAWDVFKENGFERTTMSEISERVGGSKATLYGYFQSKELLFAAALEDVIGAWADAAITRMTGESDLKTRLLDFSRVYLETRMSADMLAVERALINEGERSDLGARLLGRFVQPRWRRVATTLDQEMQVGRLRRADPILATWHFRGLIEADLVERRLHGDTTITAHEIETAVTVGVDAFLRAYEP
jgi:AcrR family transcriptional regulator